MVKIFLIESKACCAFNVGGNLIESFNAVSGLKTLPAPLMAGRPSAPVIYNYDIQFLAFTDSNGLS